MRGVVFQQDGASCHTTKDTRAFIMEWLTRDDEPGDFGKVRLISLKSPFEWPARSPDLSACDFWLWGYLKHVCYLTPPKNAEDLLNRIEVECRRLERETPDVFQKVR